MAAKQAYRVEELRLQPGSRAKEKRLRALVRARRDVYNFMHAHLLAELEATGTCDFRYETLCKRLRVLRGGDRYFRDQPSVVQRAALRDLSTAWKRHMQDRGGVGRPKFRRRYASADSFSAEDGVRSRAGGRRIFIPKTGCCRTLGRRRWPDGKICKITVKHDLGAWRIFLFIKVDIPVRAKTGKIVGVDANAGNVAIHDGESGRLLEPPAKLPALWKRARERQRSLSRLWRLRKAAGHTTPSKRMIRERREFRRICRRIRNIMHCWRHRITAEMAREYDVVRLEKLELKAMTAAGGARKKTMNREFRRTGHGYIRAMLRYKADAVEEVDAAHASLRCSVCGHAERANRPSRAVFRCRDCGHEDHADINAALNVRSTPRARGKGLGTGGRERAFGAHAIVPVITPKKMHRQHRGGRMKPTASFDA